MHHRDGGAWDERDGAWEDEWEPRGRPRKGLFGRVFSLLKIAVFVAPLALFLYGFLVDCRARPSAASWAGLLGATACARNEILGSAASMPDNLAVLRRLIN